MQEKTTCVLTLFYSLQKITLKLLHINIHVPKVCKQKRERERERERWQIEGEHTQFKREQSMQEKQLVCSLSSVTFSYKPFQYIDTTNWSGCTKITHLPTTLPKVLQLFIRWKERNLDLIVYRNDGFYDFIYRWRKGYRETLTE